MSDHRPQATPTAHRGHGGHEPLDIRIRGILFFGIALIVVAAVLQVVLGWMMYLFSRKEERLEAARPALFADESGQYPGPQLQDDPTEDMDKMRAIEQSILEHYGWADRRNHIARIPISRAMDLVAESTRSRSDAHPQAEPEGQSK
ncbi:MAG: hypothetical protein IRY99_00250 [Isosphaeraceae bacterium]|nr:hypothetical protein [Isosphaeraceae bacterium]